MVRLGVTAVSEVAAVVGSGSTASVTRADGVAPGHARPIPVTAFTAYLRAAAVVDRAAPECRLEWPVLAAIGGVESDHGRAGGARLSPDGVSSPAIRGPALDGTGPLPKAHDTDAGELDEDARWDRAVGPMQMVPSAWTVVGVDGDGDGVRSPNDLDDAALAAAVWLCAGTDSLDERPHLRAALLRYNDSRPYLRLVMSYLRQYRALDLATAPAVPWPEAIAVADPAEPSGSRNSAGAARDPGADEAGAPGTMRDDQVTAAGPSVAASPLAASTPASPDVSSSDKPPFASQPTTPPSPSTSAAAAPTSPTASTPASASEPTEKPSPKPEAEPSAEGMPAKQPSPTPTSSPATDPQPTTPPASTTELEGLWTSCEDGYCLDGTQLPLGEADPTGLAAADYDGDGRVEEHQAELAGLVDQVVAVVLHELPEGAVVVAINGLDYTT